jgi:hypothetical protein
MVTEYDVYYAFRRAQSLAKDRGFRMPKDWDSFKLKMNPNNAQWLKEAAMYFTTTYSNVDLCKYMECGFEIWKGFTYKHFTDKKVIDLYIHKDKVTKWKLEVTQREIETTFNTIADYMLDKPWREGYTALQSFCKYRTGETRIIINTYVQGKIDIMTLAYCVYRKYIILTDDERALSPYLVQRYRELMENLQDVKPFIETMERELDESHGR